MEIETNLSVRLIIENGKYYLILGDNNQEWIPIQRKQAIVISIKNSIKIIDKDKQKELEEADKRQTKLFIEQEQIEEKRQKFGIITYKSIK